jgi:conjugative transposon TraN protein
MLMRLNNIYSVGDYFFLDFSIENRTNIRFDIDELRFKLSDKKQSKATNSQIIELTPALVLDQSQTFRYGYRNVVVLKKMTFPNDKVLTIEVSEKQISGRTIKLNIDYEDVLYADSFNDILLKED